MKLIAVVCNILFWGFFWFVLLTDGPPEGSDILSLVFPLAMPILNVLVIRLLPSPGRIPKIAVLLGNIIWLIQACWLIAARYPSHPGEEGLLEFAILIALTPVLSVLAILLQLRTPEPVVAG